MNTQNNTQLTLASGAVIGVLSVIWIFVMGLTGWTLDPVLFNLFWVAVAIHAGVLALTLWRTRPGQSYRAQLGVGLAATAVAAVLVFVGWLVFTGFVMPDYFESLRAAQEQALALQGLGAEEISKLLDKAGPSRTPGGAAFAGFMGTLATGMLVSLVIALFFRDRQALSGNPKAA